MDESEDFQDYTIATSWERLVADIQSTFTHWLQSGILKGSALAGQVFHAELSHSTPFRLGTYRLTLHIQEAILENGANGITMLEDISRSPKRQKATPKTHLKVGGTLEDNDILLSQEGNDVSEGVASRDISEPGPMSEESAKLCSMFGLKKCVVLAPNSYSGRIMNEQEARTLLSALSVAASSSRFAIPCFVPVLDSLRDAYWGIGLHRGLTIVHYNTDTLQNSTPAERLFTPEGQIGLFAEQLKSRAPQAATICLRTQFQDQSPRNKDSNDKNSGDRFQESRVPRTHLRQTFVVPDPTGNTGSIMNDEVGEEDGEKSDPILWREKWDDEAAWWPWASQPDPCSHLELDVDWHSVPINMERESVISQATLKSTWSIYALAQHRTQWSLPAFFQSTSGTDRPQAARRFLILSLPSQIQTKEGNFDTSSMNGSFTSMLQALKEYKTLIATSSSMSQLLSPKWWTDQGHTCPSIPSESLMKDVLRDIFSAPRLPQAFGSSGNELAPDLRPSQISEEIMDGLAKCAPAESLAARLSLHTMTFSNPRAVALLWSSFVRELRFSYWEQKVPLPRMSSKKGDVSTPDMKYGLLYQKLQMLNFCIHCQNTCSQSSEKFDSSSGLPVGVKRKLEGKYLTHNPNIPMNEPFTQATPVSTEDMLLEQEMALSALSSLAEDDSARSKLQGKILGSDMGAFKAANPESSIVDFVRWHSPKDWIPKSQGHPEQGSLSKRIGGIWNELWNSTEPCPASLQNPLMDPILEGERVLHWFEDSASPEQIWSSILSLSLSTAFACLSGSDSCGLNIVKHEMCWYFQYANRLLSQHTNFDLAFCNLMERFTSSERLVVAAESLLLRLPGQSDLVEQLLLNSIKEGSCSRGVEIQQFNQDKVDLLMKQSRVTENRGNLARACNIQPQDQENWPLEMQREWVINFALSREDCNEDLYHRMYVCIRSEEMRIATRICNEL